jgi:hypothetical protein
LSPLNQDTVYSRTDIVASYRRRCPNVAIDVVSYLSSIGNEPSHVVLYACQPLPSLPLVLLFGQRFILGRRYQDAVDQDTMIHRP